MRDNPEPQGMIPSYIPFQTWACTRDFLEDLYLMRCRFLVSLGAPLPKLLMSTIFICHGSMN
jgi:hypothetical protein